MLIYDPIVTIANLKSNYFRARPKSRGAIMTPSFAAALAPFRDLFADEPIFIRC